MIFSIFVPKIRFFRNMKSHQNQRILMSEYVKVLIAELDRLQRYSTSRNYRRALESFRKFRHGEPLFMDALTAEEVLRYNHYLQESGLQRNTISFYNRILRSVYNQAVQQGYAPKSNPFENVYTGVDVTRKRALSAQLLHQIAALPLSDPDMALARDLFLFSFMARGMSFVDMAYLTQQNLQPGFLHYVRRKTGQALSVRIEPWMQEILDKYRPMCHAPYLLPILHTLDAKEAFKEYTAALGRHDRMLRLLGERVGADFPLSSYCARHSWATIARDLQVPLSVISSGMGHTSEKTTRIYLASLDNSLVDRANRQIWDQIVQTGSAL